MGAAGSSHEEELDVHLKTLPKHRDKFIAAAFSEAEEDSVLEALGDGKLLADFAKYLKEQKMWSEIIDLWKLDTVQSLPLRDLPDTEEEATRIVMALSDAWQAYQQAPEGRGDFEDAQAWADLDMPSSGTIDSDKKKSSKSVDSESELYNFAIAAMVGIHVSTVCNDIFLRELGEALKMTGVDAAEEFYKSFPHAPVEECLKRTIREFHIPLDGTAYSPKTGHVLADDYQFEELCPQLFAGIRRLAKVSNEDYFNSVCRTDFEFIQFGSNSKSGEIFFFSHDMKYLLKTSSEIEVSTLMSMLADYESHLAAMPYTFLGHYLGLYRLTIEGVTRLFFVMRSVSDPDSGLKISKSFDIKGSTRHRRAPETDSVGKDINFDEEVEQLDLDPQIAEEIVAAHKADCELLRRYQIMDFSFLIQIHDAEGKLGAKKSKTRALNFGKPGERAFGSGVAAVKLKGGPAASSQTWFNQSDSSFAGLHLTDKIIQLEADSALQKMHVKWSPSKGIKSPDGRFTYFFGLIDMLVPYTLYPKAQYAGTHLLSCLKCTCDGNDASRVPPDRYCDRQEAKVAWLAGLPALETSDDGSSG